MADLTIRHADHPGDAAAMAELFAVTATWHADRWPQDVGRADLSNLTEELRSMDHDDGTCRLVAEVDATLAGIITGAVVNAPTFGMARYPGPILRVPDIVVHESSRRHGVGRALLDALVEWGKARGAVTSTLTVHSGNAAAQALYEQAGFRDVDVMMRRDF